MTEACLWVRSPFGLSKDLGPKWCPNTWTKKELKIVRDFMKVEEGGVHCKRYEGHCTK
jgi:hypothetical protein